MSGIAKTIIPNVYVLKTANNYNEYSVYLILLDNYQVLINSGNQYDSQDIIRNLIELVGDKLNLKYIILQTCLNNAAGGTARILQFFSSSYIVIHYPDSIGLRLGKCNNEKFSPSYPSIEIKDKIYRLNEDFVLIRSGVPTAGSINIHFLKYNVLFTSTYKLSLYGSKIKYLCTPIECKKVS